MELPIEKWIAEKSFSIKTKNLFSESILCYKVGAYRASLLFSYTSFLTHIKEVILRSKKPSAIPQGRWDNLMSKLPNEDLWEENLLNELFNSSTPIFNISENLRQQIKYWKDRRNDCAHYKENEIGSHHVEAFWSFLLSNLIKITIEGGKESLLKKFKDHFDETLTPQGEDFTPLIIEIESAVKKIDLQMFFEELISNIDPHFGLYAYSKSLPVLNKIFEISSESTNSELSSFLKTNNHDLEFLQQYPSKIGYFNNTPPEVRSLWKTKMIKHGIKEGSFKILAALLRNNLIPHTEIQEAIELYFDKFDQARFDSFTYSDEVHLGLSANGFGEIVFKIAIDELKLEKFMWVNSKAELIGYYIGYYPLKIETVKTVCTMSSGSRPSQWLEREILKIFSMIPAKKHEFHEIAASHFITIPTVYL